MSVPTWHDEPDAKVESPVLQIALLCDFASNTAGTILDHINGIRDLSHHNVTVINFRGELPKFINLERFDGLIIHYSLVACSDPYISPFTRIRIRNFQGVKIAFVQDDYRFIDDTVEALAGMRINGLLGLAGKDIIDDVYSPEKLPGVRRETVLTGYVPEYLLNVEVPEYEDRPIDIGYRARKLSAWLGSHGQEKWIVADKFIKTAARYGLKYDISWHERDRIYGDDWLKFVSSCKATIGAESGSGVCDFTGEIQENVEAHLLRDPEATFEELRDLYFKDEDGRLLMNVISPRCFEAAALRTLMVMYEGDYSGRLVAGRHYVVLDRDHGNMDEVVAILRDPEKAKAIIDNAYNEVALNPANTFGAMVEFLDEVITERYAAVGASNKPKPRVSKRLRRPLKFLPKWIFGAVKWTFGSGYVMHLVINMIDWVLKFLPETVSEKVRLRLRGVYRRYIKRETRIIFSLPVMAVYWLMFFTKRYKVITEIFGKDIILKHHVFIWQTMNSVFYILELMASVVKADGVKVIMAYDSAPKTIVFRAYNSDFPLDLGSLKPIHINDLAREVEQGNISPKRVVWSPVGLKGISRLPPFTGTYEFSNLEWGLKNYRTKLIKFLQIEILKILD